MFVSNTDIKNKVDIIVDLLKPLQLKEYFSTLRDNQVEMLKVLKKIESNLVTKPHEELITGIKAVMSTVNAMHNTGKYSIDRMVHIDILSWIYNQLNDLIMDKE